MNAGPYPESTDETAKTQRRQATNAREHAWVAPSLALDGEAGGSQALPAGVSSTEASSEPECGGEMYEFDYGGNALEIDACAQGHGYWLDGARSRGCESSFGNAPGTYTAALEPRARSPVSWINCDGRADRGGSVDRRPGVARPYAHDCLLVSVRPSRKAPR